MTDTELREGTGFPCVPGRCRAIWRLAFPLGVRAPPIRVSGSPVDAWTRSGRVDPFSFGSTVPDQDQEIPSNLGLDAEI